MPTLSEIAEQLTKNPTLTNKQLGGIFGVTKQRINQIRTGSLQKYRQTDASKRYRLHQEFHDETTKLKKPCTYCAREYGRVNTPTQTIPKGLQ